MKINKLFLVVVLFLFPFVSSAWSYWVWSPESGKFVNPEGGTAQDVAEEQFNYAMRFYREKNFDEAIKQLESLLEKHRGARVAGEAQYRLGTIFEEKGDYLKAFDAYKRLIKSYPQSDRFTEVVEREFRIANLFQSGQKAKLMGFQILPAQSKAAEIFRHIVEHAPYSEYGDQAQFQLGVTYRNMGRFNDANEAFQAVIDQYPQSELVAKARFQLAETSFQRSAAHFRDQRALDDASRNVDRFLERYPDTATSEEALKLRQFIDEKNAEKNYRVGLYYEKQNYLKSALIYYEDVSVRYPHTKWGQKAAEKLQALQQPAEYLNAREKEIAEEKKALEHKLKTLPEGESQERERLERNWERVNESEKSIGKEKEDSLKRRREDLKRREGELNQRFKNLAKKRKLSKGNTSEDFARAMDRWHAALVAEKDALLLEKKQLTEWHETLGVEEKKEIWDALPFVGEPATELEKVRRIDAKKLFQVSEEKQELFKGKESLYRELEEAATLLSATNVEKMSAEREGSKWMENIEVKEGRISKQQQKLKSLRNNIESLESDLDKKRDAYQKEFGQSKLRSVVTAPAKLVAGSTKVVAKSISKSAAFINPFDGGDKGLESKNRQELLEYRMHLKEQITAQQDITKSLAEAFDAELALQEQKQLMAELEKVDQVDPHALRKKVKGIEKEIRSSYEEIEDRDKRKKELLQELDRLVKESESAEGVTTRSARMLTKPVKATGRAFKAFLFGSEDEQVEVTEAVKRISKNVPVSAGIEKLMGEIELQNLMIEAKSNEIKKLEKELEIVKAKASLAGGFKFRSAFVDVPYQFIGGAINSAKKMIPRKEREEILIQRLDEETQELENQKAKLAAVEARLRKLSPSKKSEVKSESKPSTKLDQLLSDLEAPKSASVEPSTPKTAPAVVEATPAKEVAKVDQKLKKSRKKEIDSLIKKITVSEKAYQKEKKKLESQIKTKQDIDRGNRSQNQIDEAHKKLILDKYESLMKQRNEIEKELQKMIVLEKELEQRETEILEKRMSYIDRVIQTVQSKAMSQDLLNERDKIEGRISQIHLRRDFLTKELERFRVTESPTAT